MSGKRKRSGRAKADTAALAEDLLRSREEGHAQLRSTLAGFLDADREDAVDLAIRIEAESSPAGNLSPFPTYLLEDAEYVVVGPPRRVVRLIVVLVTTKETTRPDAAEFGENLIASGFFEHKERILFYPAWFPSAQLLDLPLRAVRRLLFEMIEGKPPSVLRSGDAGNSDRDIMLVGIDASDPAAASDDWQEVSDDIFESWSERTLKHFPEIEDIRLPGPLSQSRYFLALDLAQPGDGVGGC